MLVLLSLDLINQFILTLYNSVWELKILRKYIFSLTWTLKLTFTCNLFKKTQILLSYVDWLKEHGLIAEQLSNSPDNQSGRKTSSVVKPSEGD